MHGKLPDVLFLLWFSQSVSTMSLNLCRHGVVGDSPFQEAEEFKNQSVVYVGIDGILAGVIYVEDQIREDARHVIESLTRQGINTYLLSGDKRGAAEYVASAVGIPSKRVSLHWIPILVPYIRPCLGRFSSYHYQGPVFFIKLPSSTLAYYNSSYHYTSAVILHVLWS